MQPIPLTEQLHSELTSFLKRDEVISEFQVAQYLKKISKHADGLYAVYLKGMVYAAAGRKSEAVKFFELSIQSEEFIYHANYLAYLDNNGAFPEWKELAEKFSDKFSTVKSFAKSCVTANIFTLDCDRADYFLDRYVKLHDQGSPKVVDFISNYHKQKDAINKFLETASFDICAKNALVDSVNHVLTDNNLQIKEMKCITGTPHDKYLNVFNITVNSSDVDLLTDINIEVAYQLAEKDELIGKNFSVWLSGEEAENCQ